MQKNGLPRVLIRDNPFVDAVFLKSYRLADFGGGGFLAGGDGEAISRDRDGEGLAAEADVFDRHIFGGSVGYWGDCYTAVEVRRDAEDIEEYHLRARDRADVALKGCVVAVLHHIRGAGVAHIGEPCAPPENAAKDIRGKLGVAHLVKLGADLVCEVSADTAAAVVDIILIVGNIEF